MQYSYLNQLRERQFLVEKSDSHLLGKGGFGKVYMCYDVMAEDKEYYAAKCIPIETKKINELMSLFNEILVSEYGRKNPNLVKFIDISEGTDENGNIEKYLIYELCKGGDLKTYIENYLKTHDDKSISEIEIQKAMKDILNGLSCLHRNGVIHHDLKPQNILLQFPKYEDAENFDFEKCTYKLTDFGLASFGDQAEEGIGGTFPYMDPKLITDGNGNLVINENQQYLKNPALDIWSIGIIAYELLFNKNPFMRGGWSPDFRNRILQNIASGNYTINLNGIERISKEFLCFLEDCLRFEPLDRKSSEQLEFTRFITRDYSKFSFINSENYQEELPSEYIGDDNTIVLPIFSEKKLEEHFDL